MSPACKSAGAMLLSISITRTFASAFWGALRFIVVHFVLPSVTRLGTRNHLDPMRGRT
jgi:hypothetical protein